ncbi:serine/threonine protein phosphatase 1 [Hymenobacter daecheongensis DSM 21074]|uniref:Serine/threonine protein phosphatase 1 n=1 Tax=Hymenobacter daecheongensis DSM 21074 TaxID=1121955 RepID=A0A1M6B1F5_9BACT|nr:metallophosphoesterase family protein [Hymenobacter daecheongensis]SHI42323.1 serine/threonine protein phosphatase 1 [Hymenobacter daecheongensis DSM 21074]
MARYVLTDLHGCLHTTRHLLENVLRLRPQDELYVLGDYVNKGPDSRGVLDLLMQLPQRGYQLWCLRGNHDQELLDAAQGRADVLWASAADRQLTLQSFGVAEATAIPSSYLQWLASLPYQFDIPGFTLVHAGFDFRLPPAEMRQDPHTMMNIKQFTFDASRLQGRRLLHGHVPTPTAEVQQQVAEKAGSICLDTGCVYRHNPELAHLAALELDSFHLTLQPNIELPYPIAVR